MAEKIKKRIRPFKAIIGIYQMKKIEDSLNKRIKNSNILKDGLKKLSGLYLTEVKYGNNQRSSYLNFVIKVENRKIVQRELLKYGIDSRKGYLINCGSLEKNNHFIYAARLENEALFLPNNSKFPEQDIKVLADRLKYFFERKI